VRIVNGPTMMAVQAASDRSVVAVPSRGLNATAARGDNRQLPRQERPAASSTRGRLIDMLV